MDFISLMMGAFAQHWSLDEGKTIQYVDVEKVFAFALLFLRIRLWLLLLTTRIFIKQ